MSSELPEDLPSGKWLQRVPRTLHLKLSALAKREGISLNQLVVSILAEAVGRSEQLDVAGHQEGIHEH